METQKLKKNTEVTSLFSYSNHSIQEARNCWF